jgi:hypothetical protein
MQNILNLRNYKKQIPEPLPPPEQYTPEPEMEEPTPPKKSYESLEPISWKAPEYTHHYKTTDWFWAVGILTLGFLATAIIMSNYLFAIFIAIAGFSLAMYGAKPPRILHCSVSVKGIQIGTTLHPFNMIESFWVFYDPPVVKELSIKSQKPLLPYIKIPLGDANPTDIRMFLMRYIPEEHQEESTIDFIAQFLRL